MRRQFVQFPANVIYSKTCLFRMITTGITGVDIKLLRKPMPLCPLGAYHQPLCRRNDEFVIVAWLPTNCCRSWRFHSSAGCWSASMPWRDASVRQVLTAMAKTVGAAGKTLCWLLAGAVSRSANAYLPFAPDYGSLVLRALCNRLGARRVLCYRLDPLPDGPCWET